YLLSSILPRGSLVPGAGFWGRVACRNSDRSGIGSRLSPCDRSLRTPQTLFRSCRGPNASSNFSLPYACANCPAVAYLNLAPDSRLKATSDLALKRFCTPNHPPANHGQQYLGLVDFRGLGAEQVLGNDDQIGQLAWLERSFGLLPVAGESGL